jgi:hypothetical protein
LFFYRKFRVFADFFVFFGLFRFRNCVSVYTETESFDVSIEPKQTEDPPKQFKREYIWVFFKFLGLLMKQTETNAKQILFRFVSVRTEIYFCLFRGHPTCIGIHEEVIKKQPPAKYLSVLVRRLLQNTNFVIQRQCCGS